MRKSIVLAVSFMFVVGSAFAQQTSKSNAVSVFMSDLSFGRSTNGVEFNAAYGAAFDHMFNDRFSAEVSVTSQRFLLNVTTSSIGGQPLNSERTDTVYPVDATFSYHFFSSSRWKPFVGAGVRYVSETFHGTGPLGNERFTSQTTNPEISGGVNFEFRPNMVLRFDAKQVIGSRSFEADRAFKASLGLGFRF